MSDANNKRQRYVENANEETIAKWNISTVSSLSSLHTKKQKRVFEYNVLFWLFVCIKMVHFVQNSSFIAYLKYIFQIWITRFCSFGMLNIIWVSLFFSLFSHIYIVGDGRCHEQLCVILNKWITHFYQFENCYIGYCWWWWWCLKAMIHVFITSTFYRKIAFILILCYSVQNHQNVVSKVKFIHPPFSRNNCEFLLIIVYYVVSHGHLTADSFSIFIGIFGWHLASTPIIWNIA